MNYTTYSTGSFVLHRPQLLTIAILLAIAAIASLSVAKEDPIGGRLFCFFLSIGLFSLHYAERMKWQLIERAFHNFYSQVIHNKLELNQTNVEATRRCILANPDLFENGKWVQYSPNSITYKP